jgi:hypothetical protein
MKIAIYLLMIVSLAAPQATALPDALTLSGVVTDARSHVPIAQAMVSVVGGRAIHDEVADVNGIFVLTLLETVKPGDIIRLRVQKTGYETYDENVTVPSGGKLPKPISLRRKSATDSKHAQGQSHPSVISQDSAGSAVSNNQQGGITAGTVVLNQPVAPCTPGRPRADEGPDGYKAVCAEDLAEWAIQEADRIAGMAETCKKNLSRQGLAESGSTASEVQWRFDLDFKQCCTNFVKQLRNEVLHRLGPLAVNSHEQDNWEFLFPEERSLPLGFKLNTEPHQIGCAQVQDYAPYLRMLGRQLKRRITSRSSPKPLHFEETPLPSMKWPDLFGIEVTIDTSVPIVGGYVVAEFNGTYSRIGADVGRPFYRMPSDPIDNEPLTEYLDRLPHGSFTVELPENFFAPGKPIRIRTYGLEEFHTVKVTLFDE